MEIFVSTIARVLFLDITIKQTKVCPKKSIQFSTIMLLCTGSHEKSLQSDFECDVVLTVSV